MTLITFVKKAKEKIKKQLTNYLDHDAIGMTKEQYLMMCEQTGEEIDWERCPPEWEDFPESVTKAMSIYHQLGNKVYPDIGYTGKDYTNLNYLYKTYYIQSRVEKDWIFELLLYLDSRTVEESQKKIKAEYDKIKKK